MLNEMNTPISQMPSELLAVIPPYCSSQLLTIPPPCLCTPLTNGSTDKKLRHRKKQMLTKKCQKSLPTVAEECPEPPLRHSTTLPDQDLTSSSHQTPENLTLASGNDGLSQKLTPRQKPRNQNQNSGRDTTKHFEKAILKARAHRFGSERAGLLPDPISGLNNFPAKPIVGTSLRAVSNSEDRSISPPPGFLKKTQVDGLIENKRYPPTTKPFADCVDKPGRNAFPAKPTLRPSHNKSLKDNLCDSVGFMTCALMGDEQRHWLSKYFVSMKYKEPSPNSVYNPHALCATIRANVETFALKKLFSYSQNKQLTILDVGGNPRRVSRRCELFGNIKYHSCNPICETNDLFRTDLDRAAYTNLPTCQHKAHECDCVQYNCSMSVDSIYYLTPDELALLCTKGPHVACYHEFDPSFESGVVPCDELPEGTWTRTRCKGDYFSRFFNSQPVSQIVMEVAGGGRYSHPDPTELHCKQLTAHGWLYSREEFKVGTYTCRTFGVTLDESLISTAPEPQPSFQPTLVEKYALAMHLNENLTDGEIRTRVTRLMLVEKVQPRLHTQLCQAVIKKVRTDRLTAEEYIEKGESKLTKLWNVLLPNKVSLISFLCLAVSLLFPYIPFIAETFVRLIAWTFSVEPVWFLHGLLPSFQTNLMLTAWFCGLLIAKKDTVSSCIKHPRRAFLLNIHGIRNKIGKILHNFDVTKRKNVDYDWISAFRVGDYMMPRPARNNIALSYALTMRVLAGTEYAEKWQQAEHLPHWQFPTLPDVDFETWITTFFGRRKDKTSVKAYRDAWRNLPTFVRPKSIIVHAFVKDEGYAGSTDTLKPRAVMDVKDKRQVLRPQLACCRINLKLKEMCTSAMSAGDRMVLGIEAVPSIIYTGGLNPEELGGLYGYWLAKFPFVVEGDFAEFESRVTVDALNHEFQWYRKLGLDEDTCCDFELQQKVTIIGDLGIKVTREGGRLSGVPNTSLGNSYLNACLYYTILKLAGFLPGIHYVMFILGDDNLILCSKKCSAYLHLVGAAPFAEYGMKLEAQYWYPKQAFQATFCSQRFILTPLGYRLTPMIGRLLIKAGQVPHDVTDYINYLSPIMKDYFSHASCPFVKVWALKWLQSMSIVVDNNENCVVADSTMMEEAYGYTVVQWAQFLDLHPPRRDGAWLLPNEPIVDALVQTDCPLKHWYEKEINLVAPTPRPVPFGAPQSWIKKLFRFLTNRKTTHSPRLENYIGFAKIGTLHDKYM